MKFRFFVAMLTASSMAHASTIEEIGKRIADLEKAELDAKIEKAKAPTSLPSAALPPGLPAGAPANMGAASFVPGEPSVLGIYGLGDKLHAIIKIDGVESAVRVGDIVAGWTARAITQSGVVLAKVSKGGRESVRRTFNLTYQPPPPAVHPSSTTLPLPYPNR